jgi:hypothetical protein
MQGYSRGKVNVFEGDIIGRCDKKGDHTNMYIILNGHRDRAV